MERVWENIGFPKSFFFIFTNSSKYDKINQKNTEEIKYEAILCPDGGTDTIYIQKNP